MSSWDCRPRRIDGYHTGAEDWRMALAGSEEDREQCGGRQVSLRIGQKKGKSRDKVSGAFFTGSGRGWLSKGVPSERIMISYGGNFKG